MAIITDPDEIIEEVLYLKNDSEGAALRRGIKRRLEQHAMTDDIWVPEHMVTSGRAVVMNSPRVAELARQINAVMSSYTTTVTVVPDDDDHDVKADKVERAMALKRAELFTPQVTVRSHWRQMVVAFDFYKLVCGGSNNPNPWKLLQPNPENCYFELGDTWLETMRPDVIGREYNQVFKTMKDMYDQREGRIPTWNGKVWDWQRVGEEKVGNGMPVYTGSASERKSRYESLLLYEYDDGECCYIVGVNKQGTKGQKKGQILWSQPSIVGGSTYVMVPGYLTGSVELREKILPHLWGPMNVQYQIDIINTLRASRSFSIKPQVLVQRDPALLQAAAQLGITRPVPDGYEATGADTIIDIDGRPHFWVLPSDEDLKELEASKQRELEAYINTELALTQTEVLKTAAVRNIQLALGVRAQQQGPMLTFEAIGEREILKMWASSIEHEDGYPDSRTMIAKSKTPYGKGEIEKGESVTVKKGDFDFDYNVEVATASMSDQERQFMVQSALERKVSRIGTWPEVLDAAGYQDRTRQERALIEEEGYEGAAQFYGPWLVPTFRQQLAERHGILIPDPEMQQGVLGAPAGEDNAPNAFPLPETESIAGASGTVPPNG